jgi:hypothetical protein
MYILLLLLLLGLTFCLILYLLLCYSSCLLSPNISLP